MKHVFGCSSHLVFYLCHRVIEMDNIPKEECIFLLTRNYHIPLPYRHDYQIIGTQYNLVGSSINRIFAGWKVWKTRKNVRQFDALVDAYIKGDDFIYYSQVCNNDLCSLMVTKRNCVGYYVIEDGSGSYRTYNPQTFTGLKSGIYRFFLRPFFYRLYAVKNHFIETNHPKFKGCIAVNANCFPLHQQYLRVIGNPFCTETLEFTPDAIISIDPLYLQLSNEIVAQIYSKLGIFLQEKGYHIVGYKFHPNFDTIAGRTWKEAYQAMLIKYFPKNIRELAPSVCIENVLNTYHSDFYTSNSSICIYAHTMGVTCYTYMPLIEQFSDSYPNYSFITDLCQPILP